MFRFKIDDDMTRCRWSTVSTDPKIYVKYRANLLRVFDVEKRESIFKDSLQIEDEYRSNRIRIT